MKMEDNMAKQDKLIDVLTAVDLAEQAIKEGNSPTYIVTRLLDAECQAAQLSGDNYSVVSLRLVNLRTKLTRIVDEGLKAAQQRQAEVGES
jgi:hypothetical protein